MKCFISGEKIERGELSIDHVIPWSYIYSVDLWNLVFVSKSKNSSKGSKPPDKEMIEKLEQRNKRLEDIMKTNGEKNKHYEDLKFANDTNLVKSSWLACSG